MNAMKSALPFGIERIAATAPMKKANSDDFSKRSCVLSAGTLSVLLALAGCGGGGGGGPGGAPSGAAFVYPSSLAAAIPTDTVNGFVSPYALDTATPELVSVPQAGLSPVPSTGTLVITVFAIPLPHVPPEASAEPAFVVTYDPASLISSQLLNSPLQNLCPDCLKTAIAPATALAGGAPAGDVIFTYQDPNSASFPLRYSTLGMWSKLTTVSPTRWSEVGGPFSAGVLTRGIDLPITGTASYDGFFIGRFATSDTTDPSLPAGTYIVGANAHVEVVNFSGVGAVTVSTSNTHISQEMDGGLLMGPVAEPRLDLTNTTLMPIVRTSASSNSFTGEISPKPNGFDLGTGEIKGSFYGPPAGAGPPPELGGALAIGSTTQRLVGSFGLKTP